jgi:RHS repeat-associated protein
LTGDLHDAAGNLWNNGQYVWDQENRLSASAGVTYTYDGDGRRVGKSTGKLYWTGTGSDALLETAADGSIQSEYIFFNGKRVARIDSGGNVFYYFADHLGTSRIIATANGTVCYDADYYPYGKEQHVYVPNCPQEYKFTGKPRDDETGLDYFGARYYGSNVGRFLSADWSATPEPVPYADLSNPQSLNLYSYVGNNPLARFDADGHKGVVDDPQHRQQVQGDLRKLAPGTRVDSAGNVRNGNLFRRAFNHLTGHGAGQKLATNMIKSSTTFHIGVAGAQGGGTRGNSSDVYVSYSASGGSAETRTSSSATSQIASALAPASIVLGHELIHGTHIADGTISGASATHTFTEGTTTYSETYREEEFRTVGFSGFVQKGDVTENQLRHEQGLNDRAAYTPRSHWTQQTP